MAYALLYQP